MCTLRNGVGTKLHVFADISGQLSIVRGVEHTEDGVSRLLTKNLNQSSSLDSPDQDYY